MLSFCWLLSDRWDTSILVVMIDKRLEGEVKGIIFKLEKFVRDRMGPRPKQAIIFTYDRDLAKGNYSQVEKVQ